MKAPNQRCRLRSRRKRRLRAASACQSCSKKQLGAASWISTSNVTSQPKRPRGQGWDVGGEKGGRTEGGRYLRERTGSSVEVTGVDAVFGGSPSSRRSTTVSSLIRAERPHFLSKVNPEVSTNEAVSGRKAVPVKVCYVPQPTTEDHCGRHVTRLFLDNGRESRRETTINRSL